ncbi:hypothetical protein CU097_004807, partial [Rhizopus azygosporus]
MKINSMADGLHLTPFRTTTNDDSIDQLGVLDKPLLSHIETHTDKESTEENVPIID